MWMPGLSGSIDDRSLLIRIGMNPIEAEIATPMLSNTIKEADPAAHSTRAMVKLLQRLLQLNKYNVSETGRLDPSTQSAMAQGYGSGWMNMDWRTVFQSRIREAAWRDVGDGVRVSGTQESTRKRRDEEQTVTKAATAAATAELLQAYQRGQRTSGGGLHSIADKKRESAGLHRTTASDFSAIRGGDGRDGSGSGGGRGMLLLLGLGAAAFFLMKG